MADDSAFSASTVLVATSTPGATAEVPFLAQILTPGSTTAQGSSLSGTLVIDTTLTDSDLTGTNLLWIRPSVTEGSSTATKLYTAGWPTGIVIDALGAIYTNTTSVQSSLGAGANNPTLGNATLAFADGKLVSPVTVTNFNIVSSSVARIPTTTTAFSLSVSAATGSFSGIFTPNWTQASSTKPTFKGIILQKGANRGGFGFFISNRTSDNDPESGGVSLTKRP